MCVQKYCRRQESARNSQGIQLLYESAMVHSTQFLPEYFRLTCIHAIANQKANGLYVVDNWDLTYLKTVWLKWMMKDCCKGIREVLFLFIGKTESLTT